MADAVHAMKDQDVLGLPPQFSRSFNAFLMVHQLFKGLAVLWHIGDDLIDSLLEMLAIYTH